MEAKAKPTVIANHLGLKLSEVKQSHQRLIDVGLMKKVNNEYVPADESSSSILDVATSKAHRKQQQQILEGAIDALNEVDIEHRSQSSMTFAIDSEKMDLAKELIKNFRRDMGRLLRSSNQLDSVYQLSISLYPVSKSKLKQRGKL